MTAGKSSGAFRLIADSGWRQSRLLILGYHGVSLEDEHEWDGALYLSPAKFRSRMEAIKRHRCTVLPLQEALELLRLRQLPPRAVVLTFDDGTYDFYKTVCPILNEYGYPATVYLTTYWMTLQLPVVPGTWSYMLWKKRNSVIDASSLLDQAVEQLAAGGGGSAIKTKRELIQIIVQMLRCNGALMRSQQPALEQGSHTVDSRQ